MNKQKTSRKERKINLWGWISLILVFALGFGFVYGIFLFWSMFYYQVVLGSINLVTGVFEVICLLLLWGFGTIYFGLRGFNWFINLTHVREIKLYKEKRR